MYHLKNYIYNFLNPLVGLEECGSIIFCLKVKMSPRGQKKNWKYNIKMSDKEMKYWLDYLKKNEKRLIEECCKILD